MEMNEVLQVIQVLWIPTGFYLYSMRDRMNKMQLDIDSKADESDVKEINDNIRALTETVTLLRIDIAKWQAKTESKLHQS